MRIFCRALWGIILTVAITVASGGRSRLISGIVRGVGLNIVRKWRMISVKYVGL